MDLSPPLSLQSFPKRSTPAPVAPSLLGSCALGSASVGSGFSVASQPGEWNLHGGRRTQICWFKANESQHAGQKTTQMTTMVQKTSQNLPQTTACKTQYFLNIPSPRHPRPDLWALEAQHLEPALSGQVRLNGANVRTTR